MFRLYLVGHPQGVDINICIKYRLQIDKMGHAVAQLVEALRYKS